VRRLHQGRFTWPQGDTPLWTLSTAQWQWLVSGVDWRRLAAGTHPEWRV
jgi:transposase